MIWSSTMIFIIRDTYQSIPFNLSNYIFIHVLPLILQWATYLWPSRKWGFIINYIQYSKSAWFTQESRIKHYENIISLHLMKLWIPRIRLDVLTIHNIVSPRYRYFEAQYISLIDKSKDTNFEHELIKWTVLRSIHKLVIK